MAKKLDDKRLDALIAIGALIAPRAKTLAAHVTQAFQEPAAYVTAHADRMNDRGIDEPVDDLPWIALIDALHDAKALSEIDWKTEAEDVEWNIAKLARGFKLPPADDPDDDERATWELLELAGLALRKKKLQLAQLDMGSDAYPLVVVPAARFAALAKLAKVARYGAARPFGDQLGAAQKDRLARLARLERERAKEATRHPAPYIFYGKGDETWTLQTHELAFDAGYEAPGIKRYQHHYFASAKECRAAALRQAAAWLEDGFAKLTARQSAALPDHNDPSSAYLDWIGPFPEDARYYLEDRRVVTCFVARGDVVIQTGGTIGGGFGELEQHYHGTRGRGIAEHYESNPKYYKPIERDAVMALYGKKRAPKKTTKRRGTVQA